MSAVSLAIALTMLQAAPAGAAPSLQAQFDAATKAAAEGRCAEAVAGFTALEALPAVQRSAKVGGAVKLRKGGCLVSLNRDEEAEAVLRAGIAALATDPDFGIERATAHVALGRIAYRNYDYERARPEFELARDGLEPQDRFDVLIWLTRATMFEDGSQAVAYADEAMKLALATPGSSKQAIGSIRTLRARALLNDGKATEAYAELKKALAEQGGLGLKVNLDDVITRSDLAIAAWLAKQPEDARKYLAYTGAGRWEKAPFTTAASMEPPACGGDAGLKPDDVAVVEFGINDDGSISYAEPVYASRSGPMAAEFAEAVKGWSWRPEDMASVPPFFRLVTRVELRCSTASERPSVMNVLAEDFSGWLATQNVAPFDTGDASAAQAAGRAKAELAARRAAGGLALLPVLTQLGMNPVVPGDEKVGYLREASELLAAARAPGSAQAWVLAASNPENIRSRSSGPEDYGKYRVYLRSLLARPEIAGDAHAGAALRILISEARFRTPPPADAAALLQQVVDDDRLGPSDLLRVNALVRLASLQAAQGDLRSARASYERTGLTAQQCSLVDARPALRKTGASSSDFPMEAMRWGFEGWVRTEFDIAADGKTSAQRAVIAYPPFVFRDAAIDIMKGARYQQSYRPEGGPGCGGAQESVSFRIPG